MIVRSADTSDIPSVFECLSLASTAPPESLSTSELEGLVRLSQQGSDSGIQFFVAVDASDDNLVAGFLVMKRVCHLSLLFVRPDYQRMGVGRRLWDTVLHLVESPNFTVNSSPGAVLFYKKPGFRVNGEQFEKYNQMLTPMMLTIDEKV